MNQKIKKFLREDTGSSDILYSAVVLDEKSRDLLMQTYEFLIPDGWKKISHHMTIAFGKGVPNKEDLEKEVTLSVLKIGVSDMAIAARVEGYPSNNAIPHITLAVNPNGGKPQMSNDIKDWFTCQWIEITGVVTEIKKS